MAASIIESLPTEIFERIFLLSLNFNLPRASPYLAAKVSRERMYKALIHLAFWEEAAPYVLLDAEKDKKFLRQFAPYEYSPLEESEQEELQAAVLNSRWCTLSRLKQYIPDLTSLFLERYWFGNGALGAGKKMDEQEESRLEKSLKFPHSFATFPSSDTPGLCKLEVQCYNINIVRNLKLVHRFRMVPAIKCIPDGIICPNQWTDGKLDVLAFFIACVTLRRRESPRPSELPPLKVSQDALDKGIRDAIMKREYRALRNLLVIHELAWWGDTEPLRRAVGNTTHHTISANHFHTAAIECDDTTVIKMLLRSSAESCPVGEQWFQDWATEVTRYDEELGKFLQIDLLNLGCSPRPPLFVHGMMDASYLERLSCRFGSVFEEALSPWTKDIFGDLFCYILPFITRDELEAS